MSDLWADILRLAHSKPAIRAPLVRLLRASIFSKTFYHGTFLSDAREIERGGFRVNKARGRGAALGPGVYMSANRSWAKDYADDVVNDHQVDAAILHLKLKPGIKFLDVSDPQEWPDDVRRNYWDYEDEYPRKSLIRWSTVGYIARRMKYDAVGNPDGSLVVYDPKNIRVGKVEVIPA